MILRRTLLPLALLGCGPSIEMDPTGDADSTGSSTSPGPMSSPTTSSSTSGTTATTAPPDPSTTTDESTSGIDESTFIAWPDTTSVECLTPCECDVIGQDCNDPSTKCVPWANDGGNLWNANRCTEVDPDPNAAGEACTVEASPVSGVDSCDASSFCFNVDNETLQGVCVPFCAGTEADPLCPRGTQCMHTNEGTLAVCLPTCDPLASTCGEGEGCYAVGEAFHCLRVGSPAAEHDTSLAACEPGSIAVLHRVQSGCDRQAELCCAPFCDVEQPACAPPYECVSYWEAGGNPGICLD